MIHEVFEFDRVWAAGIEFDASSGSPIVVHEVRLKGNHHE